ncbi:hypothetical protein FHR24_001932 [Wenyingzhuangia heitensis]|uniref:Dolichyl-phosphate-mannose-protein mannosyltransferase n=1 Tax=Wenyingzhuangia heitensis TaxID=1487859 RepID=A0ABX0U9F9_9FLAO|nr:hypothetical protein [Wenyingzhuangia heitensis]NIJ45464.1 hypothetical protein [Wenyingzhuangia heitensis]
MLYIGPLRVLLVILFFLFIGKKVFRYPLPSDKINFFVKKWLKYGTIMYASIFVLHQLGFYDLFAVLLIIIFLIIAHVFGIKFRDLFAIGERSNIVLLYWVEILEKKYLGTFKEKEKKKAKIVRGEYMFLINVLIISFVLFYFLGNDLFTSTFVWNDDLAKIRLFNNQMWFLDNLNEIGDYSLISIYAKLTGLTNELALKTFGVIEISILSVVLSWFAYKLTKRSHILATLSMLSVVVLFMYAPTHTGYIVAHNSIYLSLSFTIPLIVYALEQKEKTINHKLFWFRVPFIFLTLFFINLHVYIVILPLFFASLLLFKKDKKGSLKFLGAYGIALFIGLVYIYFVSDLDYFMSYIRTNLIAVNTYTYPRTLKYNWDDYINVYLIIGALFNLILLAVFKKRKVDTKVLVFNMFMFFLFLLFKTNTYYIDKDVLTIIVRMFMPVTILTAVYVIYSNVLGFTFLKKLRTSIPVSILCVLIFVSGSYYYQKNRVYNIVPPGNYANTVLEAYNKILMNNLPYSYMLVNDSDHFILDSENHFLMNYDEFIHNYTKQDSIYSKYKDKKEVLKKHPEYVLPNSIYVFKYDDYGKKKSDDRVSNLKEESKGSLENKAIDSIVIKLKDRGRKVNVFYKENNISVYEIENIPNSSNVIDLMFQ